MTDDLRFDELLREDAAALPPPSDSAVNPWQTAMSQILWGMGLTTITLNLLYLDYILPALGAVLLVLGFRTLRRENAPLGWCYRLSLAALLLRGTAYVLLSLPVELDKTLAYCTSLVTLALYICLWRGMVGVSRSAGAEKPAAPAAGAMAVLYGLLLTLAYIGLEGWLLVVPLLVIYIILLRNMAKLSRSLADTGYVITAAPVRLPGWAVLWGSLGLLLASVLLAAFLGQRYPTDWQGRKDAPQDTAIRQELLELGFPEAVLNDLTADEVAALDGAAEVYVQEDTKWGKNTYREVTTDKWYDDALPSNWKYDSAKKQSDGSYLYTYRIYDVPVCTATHVAVVLDEAPQRVMFIQYVTVNGDAMTDFTQGIEAWPIWYSTPQDWTRGGYCGGQVLCDRGGQPLAAPFSRLEQTSTTTQGFFGASTRETVTAVWSWPRHAANGRAYLIFDAVSLTDDWTYLDGWCNYARQLRPVYPYQDALSLWQSFGRGGEVDTYQSYIQKFLSERAAPPAQEDA